MEALNGILEISGLLDEVDAVFWANVVEKLVILLLITFAVFPRLPKYKSKKTIDKNGDEVIITYEIRK